MKETQFSFCNSSRWQQTSTYSTVDRYQIKSNLSLFSLYYAEECNESAVPIYASLCPGNTASFKANVAAVASRWQHCVRFDGPRLEPQTSRSTDERVTARPTGRCESISIILKTLHVRLTCKLVGCLKNRASGFTETKNSGSIPRCVTIKV